MLPRSSAHVFVLSDRVSSCFCYAHVQTRIDTCKQIMGVSIMCVYVCLASLVLVSVTMATADVDEITLWQGVRVIRADTTSAVYTRRLDATPLPIRIRLA